MTEHLRIAVRGGYDGHNGLATLQFHAMENHVAGHKPWFSVLDDRRVTQQLNDGFVCILVGLEHPFTMPWKLQQIKHAYADQMHRGFMTR